MIDKSCPMAFIQMSAGHGGYFISNVLHLCIVQCCLMQRKSKQIKRKNNNNYDKLVYYKTILVSRKGNFRAETCKD